MELGLKDKRVMVTGGSRSIGKVVAETFAAEGAKVAITYNTKADEAKKVVASLGGEERACAVQYDLGDPASVKRAVRTVEQRWGGIDVLVANAQSFVWGEWAGTPYFEDIPADGETGWVTRLRENVEGHIHTAQLAVKGMRERGWGRIVLLSSVTATHGMTGSETYSTAKAAMHGFARGLMWSRNGVLANVVAPGATLTELVKELAQDPTYEPMVSAEIERTPSGRLSESAEVARLIVFLGSPANGNVNGQLVHTAGGR